MSSGQEEEIAYFDKESLNKLRITRVASDDSKFSLHLLDSIDGNKGLFNELVEALKNLEFLKSTKVVTWDGSTISNTDARSVWH